MKLYVLKLDHRPSTRVINKDDLLLMYPMFQEHPGFHYRALANNPNFFTVGTEDPKNFNDMLKFTLAVAGIKVVEVKEMGSEFAHHFWLECKPFL